MVLLIAGALCSRCPNHTIGHIEGPEGDLGPITVLCACPSRSDCSSCPDKRAGLMSRVDPGLIGVYAALSGLVILAALLVSGVVVLRAWYD